MNHRVHVHFATLWPGGGLSSGAGARSLMLRQKSGRHEKLATCGDPATGPRKSHSSRIFAMSITFAPAPQGSLGKSSSHPGGCEGRGYSGDSDPNLKGCGGVFPPSGVARLGSQAKPMKHASRASQGLAAIPLPRIKAGPVARGNTPPHPKIIS